MSEQLRAMLLKALELYNQGMRRMIKERLAGNAGDWWQSRILNVVRPEMRSSIERDMRNYPHPDRIDHLDPARIKAVITSDPNFNSVFKTLFPDFGGTAARLQAVVTARNAVMKGFETVDANRAFAWLQAMYEVLSTANMPEAIELERLRDRIFKAEPPIEPPPDVPIDQVAPGNSKDRRAFFERVHENAVKRQYVAPVGKWRGHHCWGCYELAKLSQGGATEVEAPRIPPRTTPLSVSGSKYKFTMLDDQVAFYLYKCCETSLPELCRRLSAVLGMKTGALRMRVSNFEYLDWRRGVWEPQKSRPPGPGLKNYARQSWEVYRDSSRLSCDELRRRISQERPGLPL